MREETNIFIVLIRFGVLGQTKTILMFLLFPSRKTIKKMFPEALAMRIEAVESLTNYKNVVDKFESFGKKRLTQKTGSQGQPANRWMVITKSVAILTAIIGIFMVRRQTNHFIFTLIWFIIFATIFFSVLL